MQSCWWWKQKFLILDATISNKFKHLHTLWNIFFGFLVLDTFHLSSVYPVKFNELFWKYEIAAASADMFHLNFSWLLVNNTTVFWKKKLIIKTSFCLWLVHIVNSCVQKNNLFPYHLFWSDWVGNPWKIFIFI